MRKHIFILAGTAAICTIFMAFLIATAKRPNADSKNGFTRIKLAPVTKLNEWTTYKQLREIVGITDNAIYFTTKEPGKLLYAGRNLGNVQEINLHIPFTPIMKSNYSVS